jgi:hypothetical protein
MLWLSLEFGGAPALLLYSKGQGLQVKSPGGLQM